MEVGLLGCEPHSSPIDSKYNFWDSTSPLLTDIHAYCWLVVKHIYLIVTHDDIIYTMGLLSHFMHAPQEIHYLFMLSPVLGMLVDVVFSTYHTFILTWMLTLTLVLQAIMIIKNLFLGISHSLEGTLSRGRLINNILSLSSMLKLNTMLWCMLPLRCFGCFLFFRSLVFQYMPMYCDN